MTEAALAQKAKAYIQSVLNDEDMTVVDMLHYLNVLRALVDITLNTALDIMENGEDVVNE